MAPPHGEAMSATSFNFSKPPRLPTDNNNSNNNNLHRTISDISFQMSKELALEEIKQQKELPPISEVEDAKCECCGMSEEFTPEYIEKVRAKFRGKWICGLCAEAVKMEKEKNGGKIDEALSSHMSACSRFNKFGRAYPVLFQAEAMREMLKKSTRRAKSFPAKGGSKVNNGGIARSSSCIAAITRDLN